MDDNNQKKESSYSSLNEKTKAMIQFVVEKFDFNLNNFRKSIRAASAKTTVLKVHSISSGKVEMYLCVACHAFMPHVNAWKN